MKNFPFEHDGNTFWYGRSLAIVGIVYTIHKDKMYFLMNKRGKGSPDHVGKWNITCGHLDHDETAVESIEREIWEECGFSMNNKSGEWKPLSLNTKPKSATSQVLSLILHKEVFNVSFSEVLEPKGGEEDEVEEIKWISYDEVVNDMKGLMAFNHYNVIKDFPVNKELSFKLF